MAYIQSNSRDRQRHIKAYSPAVYSDHWLRLGEILLPHHWMALCLSATFSTAFCSGHGDCVKFVFSKLRVTKSWMTEMLALCVCVCLSQCYKWLYSVWKGYICYLIMISWENRSVTTHDWPYLTQSHSISAQSVHTHTGKQLEVALGPVVHCVDWQAL